MKNFASQTKNWVQLAVLRTNFTSKIIWNLDPKQSFPFWSWALEWAGGSAHETEQVESEVRNDKMLAHL